VRVLLDECVPRRLKGDLAGHEVRTVVEAGWGGIKNGALLQRAALEFDVFLTVDQNLRYQQNLSMLPLPVIVLVALSNDIDILRPLMAQVCELLTSVRPGHLYQVSC